MTFWVLISLTAALIAGLLGFTMLRGRRSEEPIAAYDLRVYREQLAGVDRDLARGVIGAEDAERVRNEISRRILAADAKMRADTQSEGPGRAVSAVSIALVGLVLIGGALVIYRQMGAVGYPDMPLAQRIEFAQELRENRLEQAEAERQSPGFEKPVLDEGYAALLQRLRDTVAQRPDDLQGHILLAQHETNAGNFKEGYQAQARVIALSGDQVTGEAYADLAEMMILAAGGYVSREAEDALTQALNRAPDLGPARYYWGQLLAQTGRPDQAYVVWVEALRDAPANAPWADAIRFQIDEMAFRAGVFNPPEIAAAAPGPSDEDVQAAAELTPEERQEMIVGMVENLSDRLATDGGSAEEWARLIAALGVLGQTERAQAIHEEALATFAQDDAALQMIAAAARQAGIAQ